MDYGNENDWQKCFIVIEVDEIFEPFLGMSFDVLGLTLA